MLSSRCTSGLQRVWTRTQPSGLRNASSQRLAAAALRSKMGLSRHVAVSWLPALHEIHAEESWKYRSLVQGVAFLGLSSAVLAGHTVTANESPQDSSQQISPGISKEGLPVFRMEEVEKRKEKIRDDDRVWVVYQSGVYDITSFIEKHPGGRKIMLGAGQSIEPFWRLYAAHHHQDVYKTLESYRIGNLHPEDVEKQRMKAKQEGPYANEPVRHPALRVNSMEPFNAEPPPELLMESFVTPNEIFFVRNHLPVPKIDEQEYKLEICIDPFDSERTAAFTLQELKEKFKLHSVTTTIQCAGNRRSEMSSVKKVKGLNWENTAISTAKWTGVLLSDVLDHLGVDENDFGVNHVCFEGLDVDEEGKGYGASIPAATATDPRREVLLAFMMNDVEIPRDHGAPLRAIVPGTVGARNVKYLGRVIVSDQESGSFWQQKDYKGFPPNVDYQSTAYWTQAGPSIQDLPVQSAITEPKNGSRLKLPKKSEGDEDEYVDTELTIKGYAWSGGGRGIVRVDVSIDGGKTWMAAELSEDGLSQKYGRSWAWTPWEVTIDLDELPEHVSKLDIRCKAVDSSYNSQPDTIKPIWNMRGVLNNAWHQVNVDLTD